MEFVPWRNVADWRCKGCGYCCKLYSVVLHYPEYITLTKKFGSETTLAGFNRFFIRRHSDGTCAFLCSSNLNCYCVLQKMKPDACKIWPFKVLAQPRYGEAKQAEYHFGDQTLYVYVDTMCSGLRYGEPTWEFKNATIKEFSELALGLRDVQYKTTRSEAPCNLWGRRLFP